MEYFIIVLPILIALIPTGIVMFLSKIDGDLF